MIICFLFLNNNLEGQKTYVSNKTYDSYYQYKDIKKKNLRIEPKSNPNEEKIIREDQLRKDQFLKNNPIKAVLLVGTDDGENKFVEYEEYMKNVEVFLKSKHVEVHTFYKDNKNYNWDNFIKAANGASIFVYSGHGYEEGIAPVMTKPSVLNSEGQFFSHSDIAKKLKLRKNALVIYSHACYGAGSSQMDPFILSVEEAESRVNNKAECLFKAGAGCYYADNFPNGHLKFLKNLYEGCTLKQCYESGILNLNKIEYFDECKFNNKLITGISSYKISEKRNAFCVAFVGRPDYCLRDLLINNK